MASALDDLDPAQLAAVTTASRLVAVLAGAGTGKTRVLTRRIAWRVHEGDADSRHTLALTFTREAAGELRRRLRRLGLREQITSGTFHAVMLAMLRQRATDHGRPAPQIVASRHRLLKEIGTGRQTDIVAFEADWCGARGIPPEDYVHMARAAGRRPPAPPGEIARLLGAYAVEKRRRGVIDINDVLVESLLLLEREPAFAEAVRWRFRHVLVDEAQDLNPVQHRLIDVLRAGVDDLYMVGDPSQAIYGFNGADPTLLAEVGDRFPGIEIVRLGANHRCTPQVVDFGRHVLHTSGQLADITSTRFDGPAVSAHRATDERHELEVIADLLGALDPSLLQSSDVAVLARTNAQVSLLRAALEARGIRVRRRVDDPGTPIAGVLNEISRFDSAARLRAFAHDVLDTPVSTSENPSAHDAERCRAERLVAEAVLDYLREHPDGTGTGIRSWRNATDPFGTRDASGVELLTFHTAKGREWHTVVLAGIETGLVPLRSSGTVAGRAEEARLLYVAATRARERLVISSAERRGGFARNPTPFVAGFVFGELSPEAPPIELRRARANPVGDRVERELLAWRDGRAHQTMLTPQQVCTDEQLSAIVRKRPRTVDELITATGLGPITAARLFDGIAAALDDAAAFSR